MIALDDVVLRDDRRGVGALRSLLAPGFVLDAARLLWETSGPIALVTGFFVGGSAPETDGPPGAGALAEALLALDRPIVLLTDALCAQVVSAAAPGMRVVAVPVDADCAAVVAAEGPGVLVAIERLGPSADGVFRGFRGDDLSATTADFAPAFRAHPRTIGVGDGGNEIGMGVVAHGMGLDARLPRMPCVTHTTRLVLASVSNWGALGLVAGLSALAGRDLLPSAATEVDRLARCLAAGAIDGVTLRAEPTVDGMPFDVTLRRLAELHAVTRTFLETAAKAG
ncbi:MAG: hypothetical protein AMXMBFR64_04380 [Myxococcales bacterium]